MAPVTRHRRRVSSLAALTATIAAALTFAPAQAPAAVQDVQFDPVPITADLGGSYRSWDMKVTTTTDWTIAAVLTNLTSGSIYQHPFNQSFPPHPGFFDFIPALQFDTYVSGPNGSIPNLAGGAVDLGGATASTISTAVLDATWFDNAIGPGGTHTIARLTFSTDANGWMKYLVMSSGDTQPLIQTTPIIRGYVGILMPPPEPAEPSTVALLACLAFPLLLRPRRA